MQSDLPARPESIVVEPDSTTSDYLQIRDYFRIIYRRRWIIAALLVIGLAGAVAYNWKTVPVYQTSAMVQIDTDLNVLGVDRPVQPLDQRDWMPQFLPTQMGILQSRELARMAQQELQRQKDAGGSTVAKAGLDALGPPDPAVKQSPTGRVPDVNEIAAGRSVSVVRDSRLVNIGFSSTDPQTAAAVSNALAIAYLEQSRQFRTQANTEAAQWLSGQVQEQRRIVQENENALQRYRQQNDAGALITNNAGVEAQNIVVQRLSELQAAETQARISTIQKEADYRQLQAARTKKEPLDTVPSIAANVHIQTLKIELAGLQRQLGQALKELGERHPDIIKLQGAVAIADRKVQTEIENAARTIENDYESARARERDLVAALRRQQADVQSLNGKAIEYTTLEREANTNREILDQLMQRSREAALAKELQSTSVRIVDWAEVPGEPALPRKSRNIMMGLIGGGGIGLFLAFILELLNRRIRSPEDVKHHLHIHVAGVVPQVKAGRDRTSLLVGNGAPPQFSELFHVLRTNLLMAAHHSGTPTILVTSSVPAEGKTLSAANLALSLARLNRRVLLIDADMRSPQVHNVFKQELSPGLAERLSGRSSDRDIRQTNVAGLFLLPAGHAPKNPSDLLGSIEFSQLLADLRTRFDWIVLDSPPVLAVTDPCLIAREASGVLLVVDCNHTTRDVATAAVERLESAGAHVVSAVLNRVVLNGNDSYLPYYHRDYKSYYMHSDEGVKRLPPPALNDKPSGAASVIEN